MARTNLVSLLADFSAMTFQDFDVPNNIYSLTNVTENVTVMSLGLVESTVIPQTETSEKSFLDCQLKFKLPQTHSVQVTNHAVAEFDRISLSTRQSSSKWTIHGAILNLDAEDHRQYPIRIS